MNPRELDKYADMERGRQAQVLLDGLKPYFIKMDEALMRTFKECPIRDEKALMIVKLQMNALTRLEQNIESVVTTGKLAEMENPHE